MRVTSILGNLRSERSLQKFLLNLIGMVALHEEIPVSSPYARATQHYQVTNQSSHVVEQEGLVLLVVQRFWRKKYGVEQFYSLTRPSYVLPRQFLKHYVLQAHTTIRPPAAICHDPIKKCEGAGYRCLLSHV